MLLMLFYPASPIGMTITENDRTGIHFNQPEIKKMAASWFKQMKTHSRAYRESESMTRDLNLAAIFL